MPIQTQSSNRPVFTQDVKYDLTESGSLTSEFYISMDELFAVSNVGSGESPNASNVENGVECLYHKSYEAKISQSTTASDFQGGGRLYHSLVEIHIIKDSSMPGLYTAMRQGALITTMKITRIGHLGEGNDNTELHSTTYTNCYIEAIEEEPKILKLMVKVASRSDTAAATDFTGSQSTTSGSTAATVDYLGNTAKTE